jgi:hypothetical protein
VSVTRFIDHILGPDIHANRPAASACPWGSVYECTTHNKIYKNNSGTWIDWATLVASGSVLPTGGTAGQVLTKNSGTDYDASFATLTGTRTVNTQTGTTYTLVLGDAARAAFLMMSNAAASTLTVPPNSSVAFPVGSVVEGAQLGAGQVTLTPGAGVTINGTPGLKIAAQYGTFGLLKTATDTWLAYGRLSA